MNATARNALVVVALVVAWAAFAAWQHHEFDQQRRRERADLADYHVLLDTLVAGLDESNYAAALELARLPAKLRGFGHVRDRNRELLAPRREQLLREFRGERPADVVTLVEVA